MRMQRFLRLPRLIHLQSRNVVGLTGNPCGITMTLVCGQLPTGSLVWH